MADFNPNEEEFNHVHCVHKDSLWTVHTRFRFMGLFPINNRAIIVKLPSEKDKGKSDLAIINGVQLSSSVITQLKSLEQSTNSTVKFIISPGDYHYLYLQEYLTPFPEAKIHLPPGYITSKNITFPYQEIDIDNPLPQLQPYVQTHVCRGLKAMQDDQKPRYELAFCHLASKSMFCADLFTYNHKPAPWPLRMVVNFPGYIDFMFLKWKAVADPKGVIWSIRHILQWDFTRHISVHGGLGNMKQEDVKKDLENIVSYLENPPAAFQISVPFQQPN